MAEFNLTPVFRMEMFIDAIINGTTPPVPQFREEFYLAKMAGMDVDLPEPFTRRELYLAYMAGMDVSIPTPVTRDEMYLAEACGMDVTAPDPVFRDEFWLDELKAGEGVSRKSLAYDVADNDLNVKICSYTVDGQSVKTPLEIMPLVSEEFIDYEADKNGAAQDHDHNQRVHRCGAVWQFEREGGQPQDHVNRHENTDQVQEGREGIELACVLFASQAHQHRRRCQRHTG